MLTCVIARDYKITLKWSNSSKGSYHCYSTVMCDHSRGGSFIEPHDLDMTMYTPKEGLVQMQLLGNLGFWSPSTRENEFPY